jgi:hypothetical protein
MRGFLSGYYAWYFTVYQRVDRKARAREMAIELSLKGAESI